MHVSRTDVSKGHIHGNHNGNYITMVGIVYDSLSQDVNTPCYLLFIECSTYLVLNVTFAKHFATLPYSVSISRSKIDSLYRIFNKLAAHMIGVVIL